MLFAAKTMTPGPSLYHSTLNWIRFLYQIEYISSFYESWQTYTYLISDKKSILKKHFDIFLEKCLSVFFQQNAKASYLAQKWSIWIPFPSVETVGLLLSCCFDTKLYCNKILKNIVIFIYWIWATCKKWHLLEIDYLKGFYYFSDQKICKYYRYDNRFFTNYNSII